LCLVEVPADALGIGKARKDQGGLRRQTQCPLEVTKLLRPIAAAAGDHGQPQLDIDIFRVEALSEQQLLTRSLELLMHEQRASECMVGDR